MGDLTKNFSKSEFACTCCGETKINKELVGVLQQLREDLKGFVTVTSSYRCPIHNEEVGGAKKSQHLLGTAADIVVDGVPSCLVYQYLDRKYPDKYGLGMYRTFTHIDVRKRRSRWDS